MKTTRNITIDPEVWHRAIAEGKRVRTSASWVCEEALRRYLRINPSTKGRRKPRVRSLEATISESA